MKTTEWTEVKRIFNAAIDLAEPERSAFLSDKSEVLRFEVGKLLRANDAAQDFISEPAIVEIGLTDDVVPEGYSGRQIDSYKIINEIGHGGMGTVYLANRADGSYDKPVAVKLIKRGMDTNAVLKRFVMERRILANLEHPNIAGLLDGGSTGDGLPYLVMEYVDGVPITQFCNAHRYSTTERLELFRKVCSAISHAHQKLVVHRDIKPSNILVTEDGTPKLLDFGIAKLLHPDWSVDTNEATATMFRAMTPEYASPEQIRGLPITTSSDVYSLGVVLYELLTGERPHKFDSRMPHDATQAVLTREPIRPSSVVSRPAQPELNTVNKTAQRTQNEAPVSTSLSDIRSLKGDLDNIILKALSKEPERRYQSVQELSEDIRRHLVGLPVTATADTTAYRLKKFVNRHRAGVLAGSLMALTLMAATGITAWQAVVAKRERERAEHRFEQVRQVTHTILFEYYDQTIKLPGSTPLLEKMVQDTMVYLDTLAAESDGDASLQSEIATAYQRIGDVQGNPYQGNLGNIKGATVSYQKSLEIREKLVAGDPSNTGLQRDLAKSYESAGDMSWRIGEYDNAYDSYQKSLQIHTGLAGAATGTVDDRYEVARARHRIGQALARKGDSDGALENFRLGQETFQEIVAAAPDVPKYRRGLGSALAKIGDIAAAKKDWQTALENHRKALDIWLELSATEPLKANLKRDVALITDRVAVDLENSDSLPDALKNHLRAIELQKEIAAADPQNVQYSSELGLYYVNLGAVQAKLKDQKGAIENIRNGLKILQQFVDASPEDVDLRRDLALSYQSAGDVFSTDANRQTAIDFYMRSAGLLETKQLRAELPDKLAEDYSKIGDLHQNARHYSDAKDWYEKSLAVWSELQSQGKLPSGDTAALDAVRRSIAKCEAMMQTGK